MCVHTYTCTHVHLHTRMHMRAHTYTCTHVHMHAHTSVHTHMHMCSHSDRTAEPSHCPASTSQTALVPRRAGCEVRPLISGGGSLRMKRCRACPRAAPQVGRSWFWRRPLLLSQLSPWTQHCSERLPQAPVPVRPGHPPRPLPPASWAGPCSAGVCIPHPQGWQGAVALATLAPPGPL